MVQREKKDAFLRYRDVVSQGLQEKYQSPLQNQNRDRMLHATIMPEHPLEHLRQQRQSEVDRLLLSFNSCFPSTIDLGSDGCLSCSDGLTWLPRALLAHTSLLEISLHFWLDSEICTFFWELTTALQNHTMLHTIKLHAYEDCGCYPYDWANTSMSNLAALLEKLSCIQTIHFITLRVDDEGFSKFASSLKRQTTLTALHLTGGNWVNDGFEIPNANKFAKALLYLTCLQKLCFNSNGIKKSDFRGIAFALGKLTCLQKLRIYDGPQNLAAALTKLTWLPKLHIYVRSNSDVSSDFLDINPQNSAKIPQNSGDFQELATALTKLTCLQSISIKNMNHEDNCLLWADVLGKLTSLRKIRLYFSNSVDTSALALLVRNVSTHEFLDPKAFNIIPEVQGCCGIHPLDVASCQNWSSLHLPRVPNEILSEGWEATFTYVSAFFQGGTEPIWDVRLMIIGDSEAGKTSLARALVSSSGCTEKIKMGDRSAALDILNQNLQLPGCNSSASDIIQCHLWDFGGHEVFYQSHTVHFTNRSLYMLTWSPVRHSDDNSCYEMRTISEIMAPLKKWLWILSASSPNALIVLVGTHKSCCSSTNFAETQSAVHQHVSEEISSIDAYIQLEIQHLSHRIEHSYFDFFNVMQYDFIRLQLCNVFDELVPLMLEHHQNIYEKFRKSDGICQCYDIHEAKPRRRFTRNGFDSEFCWKSMAIPNQMDGEETNVFICDHLLSFFNFLMKQYHVLHVSLRQCIDANSNIFQHYERTTQFLRKVYGVSHDPRLEEKIKSRAKVAKMQIMGSFGVDSCNDAGSILHLRSQLNALFRPQKHAFCSDVEFVSPFSFIGEPQPKWLTNVLHEIRRQHPPNSGIYAWSDFFIPLTEACERLSKHPIASTQNKTVHELKCWLHLHHLLGNVFIQEDYFLRDPALLIEMVKPLVHYDVSQIPAKFFRQDLLKNVVDLHNDLRDLEEMAVLTVRLLRCFKSWSSYGISARASEKDSVEEAGGFHFAISYLKKCHVLCSIHGKPDSFLVTGRLANRRLNPSRIASARCSAMLNAFYLLPLIQVGFMAQFMSALMSLRPREINLSMDCGHDGVCFFREGEERSCCVLLVNVPVSTQISAVMFNSFHTSTAHGISDGQHVLFIGKRVPLEIDRQKRYVASVASGSRHVFQIRLEHDSSIVSVCNADECAFSVVPLHQGQSPDDLLFQLPECQLHLPFEHRLGFAMQIFANDMGFFSFAIKCIDSFVSSGNIGTRSQCWVPTRDGALIHWNRFDAYKFSGSDLCSSWSSDIQREIRGKGLLPSLKECMVSESSSSSLNSADAEVKSSSLNRFSLHYALTLGFDDFVIPDIKLRRQHLFSHTLFPERHRVFISCSYEDDGTLHVSRHFKVKLQEQALLSSWYQHEGSPQEIEEAMRQSSVIIIFLSPRYLSQDRCLRQLSLALELRSASGSTKRLHVMCMHPAVSLSSRMNMIESFRKQQKCYMFLEEMAAASHEPGHLDTERYSAYKICEPLMSLIEKLIDIESRDKSDEWMSFRCWQSSEESWQKNNIALGCHLFDKIEEFVRFEAAECHNSQYSSVNFSFDVCCIPKLSNIGDTTAISLIQELYPQSISLFSIEAVFKLASYGLSDYEILRQLGDPCQSTNQLMGEAAAHVAVASSGVDFKDARDKLRIIRSNFQGVLQNSQDFNDWIRSPLSSKKVVCRVEGTDDVMFLHVLLSFCESGFEKKASKDSVWSDFTYTLPGNKELRLCAEKLIAAMQDTATNGPQGVLEQQFSLDLDTIQAGVQLFASKTDLTWFGISDNDLKVSSIQTLGTISKNQKVFQHVWQFGRAIENYLLPSSSPVAMLSMNPEAAKSLTCEVFQTLSLHFFPATATALDVSIHNPKDITSTVGCGWMKWADYSANGIRDLVSKNKSAEMLKEFATTLLAKLPERIKGSLMQLLPLRSEIVKLYRGRTDQRERNSRFKSVIENYKSARWVDETILPDADLWTILPEMLSFCASIVASKLRDNNTKLVDDCLSVMSAAQHALVDIFFSYNAVGSTMSPQCLMFTNTKCPNGLICLTVPNNPKCKVNSLTWFGVCCANCGRPAEQHELAVSHKELQEFREGQHEHFVRALCRIGSIGWHPHHYMAFVHSERAHRGNLASFKQEMFAESLSKYEQHFTSLCFCAASTSCLQCKPYSLKKCCKHLACYREAIALEVNALQSSRRLELEHLMRALSDSTANASIAPKIRCSSTPFVSTKPSPTRYSSTNDVQTSLLAAIPAINSNSTALTSVPAPCNIADAASHAFSFLDAVTAAPHEHFEFDTAAPLQKLFETLGIAGKSSSEQKCWITGHPNEIKTKLCEEDRKLLYGFAKSLNVKVKEKKVGKSETKQCTAVVSSGGDVAINRTPIDQHAEQSHFATLASSPAASFALASHDGSCATLDPVVRAMNALQSIFIAAGVVPPSQYSGFAKGLIEEGVADEASLVATLRVDPDLLKKVGMKAGQCDCLLRFLRRFSSAGGEEGTFC